MANAEHTYVSHPVFDADPRGKAEDAPLWERNHPCPVDLKPFQEALDKLTGRTWNNLPRLKVVWGMSRDDTMYVCGSWLLRHAHWRGIRRRSRVNPATGLVEFRDELVEIGTPRFYVMELHETAELRGGDRWDRSRYAEMSEDDVSLLGGLPPGSIQVGPGRFVVDVMGEVPEGGFYEDLFAVAYHDRLCCGGRGHVKGVACLGAYRPPGEPDLERVRRILWRRDHATSDERNPTPETIEKRSREMAEASSERFRAKVRERVRNALAPHAFKFKNDDPSVLANGRYHWVSGHSKSGLPQAEREKLLKGKDPE